MSLMTYYIDKINKEGWKNANFENELMRLIKAYNEKRNSFLTIYASSIEKNIPERVLVYDDYFIIRDMLLKHKDKKHIDLYLETPGGSGEAAEEIVRFLHKNFETVNFVISGQAKSAGTIMALSGDEIYMTESGSLGPIDAQIRIGRSAFSSRDYMEWVKDRREEADKVGKLNPFDATVIAQITPGELNGVIHADNFAQELVVEWLVKYKFKNWNETATRRLPVTPEMKTERAKQVASALTNRTVWRTHGRSIKIEDLIKLGLIINRIDDDPEVADIVYRIQTVIRFIFDTTASFKLFVTEDEKIFRNTRREVSAAKKTIPHIIKDGLQIGIKCHKCNSDKVFYFPLKKNAKIEEEMKIRGVDIFPGGDTYTCSCGNVIDLNKIRSDLARDLSGPIA